MKRLFFSLIATVAVMNVFSQSVEEGKKYLYYEQYRHAKDEFKGVLASKPSDPDAIYWLGQAYIADDSLQKARELYANGMTATNQNPLLMVGMGHVELLEKKNEEAKAHFDAAIEETKHRKNKKYGDVEILKAIGRAEADGASDIGIGDHMYGVEKLTQAAELDEKDPEIMLNLGKIHLKRGGEYGGEAKRAYDNALERQSNYAKAYMRIGRIFETQRNTPLFIENYSKAINVDPKYSPAYLALYSYYQNRDVNIAKELLDKYLANTEKDRETDFFYADYLFRAGQYQESLAKAKELEASLNGESYPKIHKLFALNYDRLGDSLQARQELEKYVKQENPAKLGGETYADLAALILKTDTTAAATAQAEEMMQKALAMDTSVDKKLEYMSVLANACAKMENYKCQFQWLKRMMKIRPDTTARNFYFVTDAAIKAEQFEEADTVAQMYINAYPDQTQGYFLRNKAAMLADADTSLGTAIPAINQWNDFLRQDTAKNKNRIISNIGYKVYYYANKSREYEKAIEALDEILALDPGNSYALSAKEQLVSILNKKKGSKP